MGMRKVISGRWALLGVFLALVISFFALAAYYQVRNLASSEGKLGNPLSPEALRTSNLFIFN